MNKLSEQQVKTLNEAIDKTMDIMDSGNGDPNAAIIKVAKDLHLTPDYIPVIVAAYNNGAQYAQRENGKTIAEKTAKFNTANEQVINEALYGSAKKEASYNYQKGDNFFDFKASMWFDNAEYEKTALYSPVVKSASYRRETDTKYKDEQKITGRVNTIVDSARMEKSAALDAYDDAIKDLAYYMRRADAPSFPAAIKLASIAFGPSSTTILKEAAMRFELPLNAKKSEPLVPITSQFYKCYNDCITKLAAYNKSCDEELGLLDICAKTLKPIVSNRINGICKQSSDNSMSPSYFFKKKSEELTKQGGTAKIFPRVLSAPDHDSRGSKLLGSDVSGLEALVRPQWRDLNTYEHNIMRSLDDPDHEAKLRDIAVESNITDLINTDEYLSDKDPEEVIDAYNELMEIAPEIHNKKPLLRAALRQYMESGGIDVQSLGLIGDIGRKTESRRDEKNKELAERVDKMLESEEKGRSERQRHEWDVERDALARELTVSEGRKQRAAQAEEGRKQRSAQRQLGEARLKAEKWKTLVDLANDAQARNSTAKVEKAKALARLRGERFAKIDAIVNNILDNEAPSPFTLEYNTSGGSNNVGNNKPNKITQSSPRNITLNALNAMMRDQDAFNRLSPTDAEAYVEQRRLFTGDDDIANNFIRNTNGRYIFAPNVTSIPDVTEDQVIDYAKRRVDQIYDTHALDNDFDINESVQQFKV